MASHHQVPVKDDIFERCIDVRDKIISGERKGEFRDVGYHRGLYVKQNGLMIFYDKV